MGILPFGTLFQKLAIRKFCHSTQVVSERDINNRQRSVCCWSHRATTAAVAGAVYTRDGTRRLLITLGILLCERRDSWLGVGWGTVERVLRRRLILVVFLLLMPSSTYISVAAVKRPRESRRKCEGAKVCLCRTSYLGLKCLRLSRRCCFLVN